MGADMLGIVLFMGAALLAFGAMGQVVVERAQIFRSLRSARTIELTPTDLRRRELAMPFLRRVAIPALRRLGSVGQRLTPASVTERLTKELAYAGSPVGWDAERVLAFKMLGSVGVPFVAFFVARTAGLAAPRALILSAGLVFFGYYVPEWVLRSRAGKRQLGIQRALPDALDLLSITVEAGLAFDGAVARIAKQAGGPLGEELHRVLQEMQIGKTRSEALRDLGERTTVAELKSFILAMIQADVFGISIAKVLQQQASDMRIKRRQRAEEKAQKLQVKIIFPLILCIFPSLFVVLLGPAAIQIYRGLFQRG